MKKLETNAHDLLGVLNGVRAKTTPISDAKEYIEYAFQQIMDIPIPPEDEQGERLKHYYEAWVDQRAEQQQRFEEYFGL